MGLSSPSSRRRATLLVALAGGVAVTSVVGVSAALTLAPAALLLVLLAQGIHPGEQLIERWRSARTGVRRRAAVVVARPVLPVLVARTGRLLHAALAMRPPPAAAV
ncbi:hypothetical protein DSM112329_00426 [Paraconexibacter sp. AEG42_29]|uniref:Uncharacterized protein n=1 Tax=Paraconexibacter sp. AEG42_29 TaxID=2997339 RepID=A0AAU7APN6_9ACTN